MLSIEKSGFVTFPCEKPPARIAEREIVFAVRGVAAAILFPLEWLWFVRCGWHSQGKRKISWICSVAIYAASATILRLLRETCAGGPDCSSALLAAAGVLLAAAVTSGHLQNALRGTACARVQTFLEIQKIRNGEKHEAL